MADLISRLRKAAHIEPEEVAELMEEAADALEEARDGVTSPVTSTVRILIDAIESEIRQLEGKENWKSQTARIASLRAAIDAAREASNG